MGQETKTRILSALGFMALFGLCLFLGQPAIALFLAVCFLQVQRELHELFAKVELHYPLWLVGFPVVVWCVLFGLQKLTLNYAGVVFGMGFLLSLLVSLSRARSLVAAGKNLVGIVLGYLWGLSGTVCGLLLLSGGALLQRWFLVAVLACIAADTGAYFAGRRWGVTKLAPLISPGKTVQGSVGGLWASGVVVALMFYGWGWSALFGFGWGLLIAVVAQLGDLIESLLKRLAGVKDSGSFLPGHGGALDRFDSHLFVLPLVYFGAVLFG